MAHSARSHQSYYFGKVRTIASCRKLIEGLPADERARLIETCRQQVMAQAVIRSAASRHNCDYLDFDGALSMLADGVRA